MSKCQAVDWDLIPSPLKVTYIQFLLISNIVPSNMKVVRKKKMIDK